MKIDKNLRFVLPIETDDGTIYVHAAAISRVVFEQFFIVISKAFSSIYNEGLGVTGGPRIAALMLRKVAEDMGAKDDVERGLLNEMKRLANVVVQEATGWKTIPLEEAIKKGRIGEDEVSEVENALAFFSLASAMHRKAEREGVLTGAMSLWGGQLTSLELMEFCNSLPTLTPDENSGATTANQTAAAAGSAVTDQKGLLVPS